MELVLSENEVIMANVADDSCSWTLQRRLNNIRRSSGFYGSARSSKETTSSSLDWRAICLRELSSCSIAQAPTVRPRAHYIVIIRPIMCYSEQYARFKRNVFITRRKADVDCSFQFSRQLVPRPRCGGGKCSIRRFPVCPWDDVVSATGWSKSVM